MKKSIILFAGCVITIMLLMTSCQELFDAAKETFTTVAAKYTARQEGGIVISGFSKEADLKTAGLVDEEGIVPSSRTFTFDKVGEDILICKELPLDFVRISKRPWQRSIAPSKYTGTWEAIMPTPKGFRKIFLDLQKDYDCSIYFDVSPNENVIVETRKETVLQGSVTSQEGYALNINNSSTGYTKSMKRFAGILEKVDGSFEALDTKFKFAGFFNKVKLFKLSSDSTANKKVYVGTGDFAEEKVGTKITFEVENGKTFKLTIPLGTKLPKQFSK